MKLLPLRISCYGKKLIRTLLTHFSSSSLSKQQSVILKAQSKEKFSKLMH